MICPVCIPNCCLHALWAFTTLTVSYWASYALWSSVCPMGFSSLPHICPVGIPILPCGHSRYALWAFPLCHVGIPNKRFCPVGSHKPAFFSEDLPCHYLPWGHSQFALICRVGIPNPYMSLVCPICPVAFCMPWWAYRQGHPYALLAVPLSPVDIPNKCICPVDTPNPHVFTRCLPRSLK